MSCFGPLWSGCFCGDDGDTRPHSDGSTCPAPFSLVLRGGRGGRSIRDRHHRRGAGSLGVFTTAVKPSVAPSAKLLFIYVRVHRGRIHVFVHVYPSVHQLPSTCTLCICVSCLSSASLGHLASICLPIIYLCIHHLSIIHLRIIYLYTICVSYLSSMSLIIYLSVCLSSMYLCIFYLSIYVSIIYQCIFHHLPINHLSIF